MDRIKHCEVAISFPGNTDYLFLVICEPNIDSSIFIFYTETNALSENDCSYYRAKLLNNNVSLAVGTIKNKSCRNYYASQIPSRQKK